MGWSLTDGGQLRVSHLLSRDVSGLTSQASTAFPTISASINSCQIRRIPVSIFIENNKKKIGQKVRRKKRSSS
jgi:hypothetical protein